MLEDPSLIDIMFPKTIDEIQAETENEQMSGEKPTMPDVKDTDNHTTHIYTHMMVMPKTWELWFHLDWHQKLLAEQKKQQPQGQGGQSGQQGSESKVSESMSFKDLPPDGQKQMAAQAGIQLDEGALANLQQQTTGTIGQPVKPGQSKTKPTSPIAAVSPLKSAINNKTVVK